MSLSRLAGFKCVPVVIQVLGCLAEYRPLAAVDAEAAPPLVLDCMRAILGTERLPVLTGTR